LFYEFAEQSAQMIPWQKLFGRQDSNPGNQFGKRGRCSLEFQSGKKFSYVTINYIYILQASEATFSIHENLSPKKCLQNFCFAFRFELSAFNGSQIHVEIDSIDYAK